MSKKDMKASGASARRFRLPPLAALVAVGLSAVFFAMARGAKPGPAPSDAPQKPRWPIVKVSRVRRGRVERWLIAPGRIECRPNGLETLTARASGVVAKVFKRDMDRVKKGELICELDRRPYDLALARAQAVLAENEA